MTLHGSYGREYATGRGVVLATRELLRHEHMGKIAGKTFVIQVDAPREQSVLLYWGGEEIEVLEPSLCVLHCYACCKHTLVTHAKPRIQAFCLQHFLKQELLSSTSADDLGGVRT